MSPEPDFYFGQLGGDEQARESRLVLSETGNSILCRLCIGDQQIFGYLVPNVGGMRFNIPTEINPNYSGPWNLATKQEIKNIIDGNRHISENTVLGMLGTGESERQIDFLATTYSDLAENGATIIRQKSLKIHEIVATDSRRALGFMIDLEEQTGLILETICKR